MPTLDAQRHRQQLAFLDSGLPLTCGDVAACPLPPNELAALDELSPGVVRRIESGLTAYVYQLRIDGQDYALKQARPQCLVQNLDGQTSFLNELQRRVELAALMQSPGGFAGVVPTHYASLAEGIVLSPWIEGETIDRWSERTLLQLFDTGRRLIEAGLFEWDLSAGNLLDDGHRVWLFDFGYMYRFDPLRQFNSAGRGDDVPLFHLAERFETRAYFAWLLALENAAGMRAALDAFALEKRIALDCYAQLGANLARRGARAHVLDWLEGIRSRWQAALRSDIGTLYLQEGWRSHVLDLDDDLRGRTCTRRTLQRCDWLIEALAHHFDALVSAEALLHGDAGLSQPALLARYRGLRAEAEGYLVD